MTGSPRDGAAAGWRRLDRRTLGVTAIVMAGVAVSAGTPVAIGTRSLWILPAAVLLVGAGVLVEYVRWRHTRFRCTAERLEIEFRFAVHTRKSLSRERIRNVDLTANPLHRLFGVAALSIGTGEHETRVTLSPLARVDAEALRAELLHRLREPSTSDGLLAAFDRRWVRYAPVSFVAPTLGLAAFGTLFKVADWFGAGGGLLKWLLDLFGDLPLAVSILLLLALAMVVGVAGAVGLFAEMWANYRLDREPGGTLRVRRGLLTTRSITVEERRLRGVELVEPLGARLAGAARVDAIATGMRGDDDKTESKTLLPAAPRAKAHEVAARIAGEPVAAARLVPHPVAARGRRLRWALVTVLVPVLVLLLLGALLTDVLLVLGGVLAVVALPVAVPLALDAYRALGHGLCGRYLVTRAGSVRRSTAVLTRDGVIGWTVKQSVFQRRRGLATFTATTAAGSGAYAVLDADAGEGLQFAADAVPGVLTPFLEPSVPAEALRT
ncbi:PH domain-containing protein [Amycolatopsis sp. lyj-346]|uniref:PH domain-containing protein n=1 Tax=Amycolatopsis sp. lyj-346 TaxID=2789289 RepID=UPI003979382D